MINNVLPKLKNTITLDTLTSSSKAQSNALSSEHQSIDPQVVKAQVNQFSDEKVEQLLHQQLSTQITVSTASQIGGYQLTDKELALRTVISSQQEGLLKNENSEELLHRLRQSVKNIGRAYANTSDILSSLGQLGHQQESFLASSQKHVERTLNSFIEATHRQKNSEDDNYRFELSVTTKEGDIVNVIFHSSQGYNQEKGIAEDSFNISYEVEGDLSKEEHAALTEVMTGVGAMADQFFKANENPFLVGVTVDGGDIDLGFLANIDFQTLSDFDISLSASDGHKFARSEQKTLDLTYQFNEETQEQSLEFSSELGYQEIDFSVDMSVFGGHDTKQMQQYLSALDAGLEAGRKGSINDTENSAFGKQGDNDMRTGFALFKSVFTGMSTVAQRYSEIQDVAASNFLNGREIAADLVDNMITNDPRYKGLKTEQSNTLGGGISKLADFDATFSYAIDRPKFKPRNTVELSQATEEYQLGKLSRVDQSKTVDTHFDYQLTRPDYYDRAESYQVSAARQGQELLALDQKHTEDIDEEKYRWNPDKNQFELMMARTEHTSSESKIRLIKDIWLEQQESRHDMTKKERIGDKGVPEDFKETKNHAHDKLVTLIGDLDKLANDKSFQRDYLVQLSSINLFMDKKVR